MDNRVIFNHFDGDAELSYSFKKAIFLRASTKEFHVKLLFHNAYNMQVEVVVYSVDVKSLIFWIKECMITLTDFQSLVFNSEIDCKSYNTMLFRNSEVTQVRWDKILLYKYTDSGNYIVTFLYTDNHRFNVLCDDLNSFVTMFNRDFEDHLKKEKFNET